MAALRSSTPSSTTPSLGRGGSARSRPTGGRTSRSAAAPRPREPPRTPADTGAGRRRASGRGSGSTRPSPSRRRRTLPAPRPRAMPRRSRPTPASPPAPSGRARGRRRPDRRSGPARARSAISPDVTCDRFVAGSSSTAEPERSEPLDRMPDRELRALPTGRGRQHVRGASARGLDEHAVLLLVAGVQLVAADEGQEARASSSLGGYARWPLDGPGYARPSCGSRSFPPIPPGAAASPPSRPT